MAGSAITDLVVQDSGVTDEDGYLAGCWEDTFVVRKHRTSYT